MKLSLILRVLGPALLAIFIATGCQALRTKTNPEDSVLRLGIPPGAEQVYSGMNRFFYEFADSGRAYLYDPVRDEVVARYQVREGQRLAVDTKARQVTLDGTPVRGERLRPGRTYHIYVLSIDPDGTVRQDGDFTQGGNPFTRAGETPEQVGNIPRP